MFFHFPPRQEKLLEPKYEYVDKTRHLITTHRTSACASDSQTQPEPKSSKLELWLVRFSPSRCPSTQDLRAARRRFCVGHSLDSDSRRVASNGECCDDGQMCTRVHSTSTAGGKETQRAGIETTRTHLETSQDERNGHCHLQGVNLHSAVHRIGLCYCLYLPTVSIFCFLLVCVSTRTDLECYLNQIFGCRNLTLKDNEKVY